MNIYDSPLWKADLDEIVASLPELSELAGKSVMITGAAGLFLRGGYSVPLQRYP